MRLCANLPFLNANPLKPIIERLADRIPISRDKFACAATEKAGNLLGEPDVLCDCLGLLQRIITVGIRTHVARTRFLHDNFRR